MPKCRPSKWVPWALLGVGLPVLGAWFLSSGSLQADVSGKALSALGASDLTKWATIEANGRDILIKGESLTQAGIDEAIKAVAGTTGVRTVSATGATLAALIPPTIESISTSNATPEIKGTWHEGVATTLAVALAGTTYKLGESPELTSSAGNWTLKPSTALPEGSFDATVEQSDGAARMAAAAAPAKIVVDLTPPVIAPPAIPAGDWPYTITGSWSEEPGATLQAETAGNTYVLGKDDALKSDGAGTYSFAPMNITQPGTYDLKLTATDAVGNITTTMVPAVIRIPETPVVETQQPTAEQPAEAELVAPTVSKMIALTGAPIIRGTWPQAEGNTLKVSVAGRGYELGKDANLSSKEGNWSLFPATAMKDGFYDVVVDVTNAAGKSVRDVSVAELEVDGEPPAAPTVNAPAEAGPIAAVTGTFDEKQTTGLTVAIPSANISAALGAAGSTLTSDGGGNWTLALPTPLAAGNYPIEVTTTDIHGRTQTNASTPEIVIAAAPEAFVAPTPPVPAIGLYAGNCPADAPWPREIKGRWSEGTALNLKAKLAGRTYELGKGMALTSDGRGTFTFAPKAAGLAPGSHTIWFTSKGPGGDVRVAKCDITVPAAAAPPMVEETPAPAVEAPAAEAPAVFVPPTPPVPAIGLYAGNCPADAPWPREIKGRWSEGTALNLKAKLAGRTYELGKGMALTSDGRGTFTFAPKAAGLAPGSHTIWFTSKGPGGDVRVAKCDITVAAAGAPQVEETPPPAETAVVPQAVFNCEAVLGRLNQVFPIRFEFDRTELRDIASLSLAQYAALLKDPRCASTNVELAGHADFRGTEVYNQGLSERRAQRVLEALTAAGIDAGRLSPKGYSELSPFDPATTDEAREKNRRVNITVIKN